MIIVDFFSLLAFLVLIVYYVALTISSARQTKRYLKRYLADRLADFPVDGSTTTTDVRFHGTPNQHSFEVVTGDKTRTLIGYNLKDTLALRQYADKEIKHGRHHRSR